MTDTGVLRADAVDVVRDGTPILAGVSVTVGAGQHWALLGPNGAGKSTLLSLLGARQHPTRGTVHVLGHQLGRVDMRELHQHVGHVNPRHPLRTPLTVRQVVVTGVTGSVEPPPRWAPTSQQEHEADQLIKLLGLAHRAAARWTTLSQGERGRALIARALLPQPRVLLLDEPATGLDLAGREQLIEHLEGLPAAYPGLATVLVTHHLEELPSTVTHAALLRDGRCLAAGPVDGVLTSDRVSMCFDHPVQLSRSRGRWTVRTHRTRVAP
ncbi:ABC transporter ATP-binding protein [Streptomyces roseochromogenus]|uniref:ABC transporter ATP-binding protein n=1 Tax=Streptomyces roseochromogenus TaxID=285450 RepID=UPI0009966702|nr:ATP-binding cassette domain-containing protein [Streptomyces roseochromogenus]